MMLHAYLSIGSDELQVEREQLLDEGKDLSSVEAEFDELTGRDLDHDISLQPRVQALFDTTVTLPLRDGYPYQEPSDLEGIRGARPDGPRRMNVTRSDDAFFDKVLGAWLGRCSGCLLGKPVEGWRSPRMWGYLKDLGRFPLADYFRSDVPSDVAERYDVRLTRPFIDRVECMPEDDDTNYTVTGLAIMKQHGRGFTPQDVAHFWMSHLPILHTFTAERVAYRNFVLLIPPPESAVFRNPYREWIGAQIRADFWGYATPGDPELAAEFAWRDACVSHVKNGIYGEMWVAAMVAAAAVESDVTRVIQIGLSKIPAKSRLAEAIHDVVGWYQEGIAFEEAISRIHRRWDENKGHHWCHTISNAQIVALGLLWGEGDFERSICRAVQGCFDTDCNGATVGSILGMILGVERLPEKWVAPLNDTVETGVAGYHRVRISELAQEGYEVYKTITC
jgi:hypothetical protein